MSEDFSKTEPSEAQTSPIKPKEEKKLYDPVPSAKFDIEQHEIEIEKRHFGNNLCFFFIHGEALITIGPHCIFRISFVLALIRASVSLHVLSHWGCGLLRFLFCRLCNVNSIVHCFTFNEWDRNACLSDNFSEKSRDMLNYESY